MGHPRPKTKNTGHSPTLHGQHLRAFPEPDIGASGLLDALAGPSALLAADGRITAVNEDWRRFGRENGTDATHQETFGVGSNYLTICGDASGSCSTGAAPVGEGLRTVLDGHADQFEYEYPCHAPNQKRWFKCIIRPLPRAADTAGASALIQHVDVTEQVVCRAGVDGHQAPLQDFAGRAGALMWQLSLVDRTIKIDPGTAVLWGFPPGETLPLGAFFERAHPEDAAPLGEVLDILNGAITQMATATVRIQDRHCEWRRYSLLAQRHMDDGAAPATTIDILAFDQSDQWHMEESHKHFDDHMRRFLENAPMRVARITRNLRYLHANKAFCKGIGLDEGELKGRRVQEVLGKEAWAQIRPHLRQAMAGRTAHCEVSFTPPRGRTVSAIVTYIPVEWVPGQIAGVYALVQDTSELKQRENQLREETLKAEQANHAKSAFLATMSHELRTPLNAILGFSDILIHRYLGSSNLELYEEYAGYIHSSAQHLLAMVNDILDLSAIEAGRNELEIAEVPLADVVAECFRTIQAKPAAEGLTMTMDVTGADTVWADVRALRQVLLNLLSNSAKFTDPGGTISVTGWREDDHITVRVSDNGCGVDRRRLADIMKPYVTTAEPTSDGRKGWGLGLSVSQSLVALHGGTLILDSDGVSGTDATFTLPVQAPR